jgi:FKBP-type peptidyl-prolyl cis-trans isomerase 2
MSQAKEGDKVKVHYTGKFEDGTLFDSSQERGPLEFTVGSGQLIPGFDQGVRGMAVGDKRTVEIAPENAYGERNEDLTTTVKRTEFSKEIVPEVGQQLETQDKDGQQVILTITGIDGDNVSLDANHPLAGKTLHFDLELVEIL